MKPEFERYIELWELLRNPNLDFDSDEEYNAILDELQAIWVSLKETEQKELDILLGINNEETDGQT